MNDKEMFVIEDDFDPLEDTGFVEDETDEEGRPVETDYLPPIPDADKSVVPEPVPLTPEETVAKLFTGLPGQERRLLCAIAFCDEPKTMDEIVAHMDEACPTRTSVYASAQIVRLLERDGALEVVGEVAAEAAGDAAEAAEAAAEAQPAEGEGGAGYLTVEPAPAALYAATPAGLAAVAERTSAQPAIALMAEEPQYLPLYERVLAMTAREGGCPTKELDLAVDRDPLCQEPRRFCGYFRGKLEAVGAIEWRDAWAITDTGRAVLASDAFN